MGMGGEVVTAGCRERGFEPWVYVLTLALALFAMALAGPAPARAATAYENVASCGTSGEGSLGNGDDAQSVAVDFATGDVYVAAENEHRVLRYNSKCEFIEAWGWNVADSKANEFQTCGVIAHAAGEAKFATCERATEVYSREGVGALPAPVGIAVDQATGNVYVVDGLRPDGVVQEFKSDGEDVVASFGSKALYGTSVESDPEQVHAPDFSGITVDASGVVYIAEEGGIQATRPAEARVMVFEPGEMSGGYPVDYGYEVEFGKGVEPEQVAFDSAGDVFVLGAEEKVYKYAPGERVTPACKFHSTGGLTAMAVDPGTGNVFVFAYKKRAVLELNSSCEQAGEIAGGSGMDSVDGLAFNPALSWGANRQDGILYAVSYAGATKGEVGALWAFAPPAVIVKPNPPAVEDLAVSHVGESEATLEASVGPEGLASTYYFEYGPVGVDCSASPEACVKTPVEELAAGNAAVPVAVEVSGLTVGTQYRFRVIATSDCGVGPVVECVTTSGYSAFSTFGSLLKGLPDGRAYELVSPANKGTGEVFEASAYLGVCPGDLVCLPGSKDTLFPMQSAPDGNAVVYEGFPFAATGEAANENEYLAARGGTGWQTRDLSPAAMQRQAAEKTGYKGFAADLSASVLYEDEPTLAPGAPAGYQDLYLQHSGEPGALEPLVRTVPLERGQAKTGANEFRVRFAGASADYSHVIFEANGALMGGAPSIPENEAPNENGGRANMGYAGETEAGDSEDLYEWNGGALRLVNVLPGNEGATAAAVFGSGLEMNEVHLGDPDYSHAISADGSHIFWTDEDTHRVYVREDGERTVYVRDAGEGKFVTASIDGARVLLSDGHLYDVDVEDPETGSPKLEADLTEEKGGFQGILGASEDLSRIYFVDTAALAGEAKKGEDNLYLWEAGRGLRFIVVLSGGATDWAASPADRTAQVTADGEYVAFESSARLTGYDNEGAKRACDGGSCIEVFEYDAGSGRLACASCNPSGAQPLGSSSLSLIGAPLGGGGGQPRQPRNLTEDGRLFFDSFDSLSPYDRNAGREDVYEYEPVGTGSCTSAQRVPGQEGLTGAGGCVFLLSAGDAEVDSSFIDASADGSDVFFVTRSQLVPADEDDLLDLYDAREPHVPGEHVGASLAEGAGGGECVSTAECRGPAAAGAGAGLPGGVEGPLSTSLSGQGNLLPAAPSSVAPKLTRAQLLARALRACRAKHGPGGKRKACEASARKRYGAKTKAKKGHSAKRAAAGRGGVRR
jgi:DNA-binding beta-propeller fold protein YncE